MEWLLQIQIVWRLIVVALAGVAIGSWVNWAIYRWAWFPRNTSPWSPAPEGYPQRTWRDRIPIIGWLFLRREAAAHGRGFWLRPLVIELLLGGGLAALYWWEVDQLGLVHAQLLNQGMVGFTRPSWVLHTTFASHAILVVLMAVASFIDIDEKTIPDRVTDPGTLLGLALATLLPMSLLPQVTVRPLPPAIGVPMTPIPGNVVQFPPVGQPYVEPVTATAPNDWPAALAGAPRWRSLAVGLGCYALWCFALAPRIWRGRRGTAAALGVISRRVVREWCRPPILVYWLIGIIAIPIVWLVGGEAWIGLLTALIGLVGGGALIWAVRIIGTAVLKREAMGFGDVTLMMMVGTFLGWQACVIIFFLAPFAGLLIGIFQLVFRRDDVIPYGPFLCLATVYVIAAWATVWNLISLPFGVAGLVPVVLAICLVLLAFLLAIVSFLKKLFLGSEGTAL